MELGKIDVAQIPFSYEKFCQVVSLSLSEGADYWAEIDMAEVLALGTKPNLNAFERLAYAVWYEEHAAKIYHCTTKQLLGTITMPSVKSALVKMSKDYNEYFEFLMKLDSVEPVDCDIFFQLACMGEVKFG